MSNETYFLADTHLGHESIIRLSQRPFHNRDQMDECLIENWNRRVKPGDRVYFAGDFCWGNSNNAQKYLDQLNGEIHLIAGNHDGNGILKLDRWASVSVSKIITLQGQKIFLSHYPHVEWPGQWRGVLHLYGHVHGNNKPLPGSLDIGADVLGFTPRTLNELLPHIQPFNPEAAQKQQIQLRLFGSSS